MIIICAYVALLVYTNLIWCTKQYESYVHNLSLSLSLSLSLFLSVSHFEWIVYELNVVRVVRVVLAGGAWHMRHYSFMNNMNHSCVTWIIRVSHESFVCHMNHSCVTWIIRVSHESFVCHVASLYVTWPDFAVSLLFIWRDSHVTWISFICDMARSYMTWSIHK